MRSYIFKKGYFLFKNGHVEEIIPKKLYKVHSNSVHEVYINNKRKPICDCPNTIYRPHRPCSHIIAVMYYIYQKYILQNRNQYISHNSF